MSKGSASVGKVKENLDKEGTSEESRKSDPKRHDSFQEGRRFAPVGGQCVATKCKGSATRFNFCDEHYDHFKFGLIKKTGELVSDYEKKIEHYVAYKAKQKKSNKVA